jgi:hypothetical protein
MIKPNWREIARLKIEAKPNGLWTLACDYVTGPKKLRIHVPLVSGGDDKSPDKRPQQKWKHGQAETDSCAADGNLGADVSPTNCLCPSAPVGALIGKIGGSSADRTGGAGPSPVIGSPPSIQVFPVGSFCILDLKEDSKGALFLTMNNEVKGFSNHSGFIEIIVEEAL